MKKEISLKRKWAYVFYALTIVAGVLVCYVPNWPMPTFSVLLPFFIANSLNYNDKKNGLKSKNAISICLVGVTIVVIAFILILLLL